ncbi:hypothetical protein DFP72DRAFT_855738 [Ephemerocybe angulata]|uniref:Uncharacterized protein n=1 Tax=Ephemerocybe angulata TaxID=980116 RepID=A0A8H6HGR7_9AGAR|nr:hypothetical protein DFP72DRAFT_855738 [Tulosesus angulatus]
MWSALQLFGVFNKTHPRDRFKVATRLFGNFSIPQVPLPPLSGSVVEELVGSFLIFGPLYLRASADDSRSSRRRHFTRPTSRTLKATIRCRRDPTSSSSACSTYVVEDNGWRTAFELGKANTLYTPHAHASTRDLGVTRRPFAGTSRLAMLGHFRRADIVSSSESGYAIDPRNRSAVKFDLNHVETVRDDEGAEIVRERFANPVDADERRHGSTAFVSGDVKHVIPHSRAWRARFELGALVEPERTALSASCRFPHAEMPRADRVHVSVDQTAGGLDHRVGCVHDISTLYQTIGLCVQFIEAVLISVELWRSLGVLDFVKQAQNWW